MQESTKSSLTRPTAEEIGKYLKYDPETGIITWRVTMGSRAKVGNEAGAAVTFTHGKKYRQIGFRGRRYYGHAIAWLLSTGHWPSQEIDHIDGDGLNNAISNLRDVSRAWNNQNVVHPLRNNRLGVRGVRKDGRKFSAQIKIAGVQKRLGTFDTIEEAHTEYMKAKRQYHPGCFHLNPS